MGLIVVNIEPNGPADQAGIMLGDVLVTLDGVSVSDTGDVQAMLGSGLVSKAVSTHVIRGDTSIELTITVGERSRREE